MMQTKVPLPNDLHVVDFCASISTDQVPYLIDCIPLPNEPLMECFSIVPKQVAAYGGAQLTGWAIWEASGAFMEAEFHAVWQQVSGVVLDVTPHSIPCSSILFLPDPKRQYKGRQVDNIRKPLVKDADLVRFFYLLHCRFEILNEGNLADQHGVITLPKKQRREYERLVDEMTKLNKRLNRRYSTST